MQEKRSYDFNGADLGRLMVTQSEAIVTVGHSKEGRLYVLPIAKWHGAMLHAYAVDVLDRAERVSTGTNKGGMSRF